MIAPIVEKKKLLDQIDAFENEMELRRQGKMDEKVFAEIRLRRGVYGQRYDNGQRHDGVAAQVLDFPSGDLTKGPHTKWDAPGMMRIKIPFGGLTPEQLEVIAELAEEYSDYIAHVTTRQDFQLHYVHIEDTPAIMRQLADVDITTQEACGNSVRNVTACPIAGVCHGEAFDVTPYASAMAEFLLGHPDAQDFGRKFKIAFSGCEDSGCGLTHMHDFGAIAAVRTVNGVQKRGFIIHVGGGLGAVPHKAKLFAEFLPEEELLPTVQAIARVFARLGEKKNRARARLKFLIQKYGIEEFKKMVTDERSKLPQDPRWTAFLDNVRGHREEAPRAAGEVNGKRPQGFAAWFKTNVYRQKQAGYATVTIKLPLGDISAHQLRQLADISRKFTKGTVRATVEQNLVLRWISEADLLHLFQELTNAQLADAGAETIEDITACPGTDTCKLGIAASRGLAAELQKRFKKGFLSTGSAGEIDDVIRDLRIKISGCFNSCGQHHIADIGFYGVNRKIGAHMVPHFQVVLGGQMEGNAANYGLAIGAVPSKRTPEFVERIARKFAAERNVDESFQAFIRRIGKVAIKKEIEDLTRVPAYAEDKSFYSDWGDSREFTLGDMGIGECAGEVVSRVEFELSAAEREIFEAQIALESGDSQTAGETAYKSMLRAARGLVQTSVPDIAEEANRVVEEFKRRFYDTEVFFDPFAGGKFANYLFAAQEQAEERYDEEKAHRRIEEAHLFVEAAYSCYSRLHTGM